MNKVVEEGIATIIDVDPVPRQLLTRAEGFFDGLFFLTLSDKLTRGQVAK